MRLLLSFGSAWRVVAGVFVVGMIAGMIMAHAL